MRDNHGAEPMPIYDARLNEPREPFAPFSCDNIQLPAEPFPSRHCKTFDATGAEISPVLRCDTETGEVERYELRPGTRIFVIGPDHMPVLIRETRPAPLRVEIVRFSYEEWVGEMDWRGPIIRLPGKPSPEDELNVRKFAEEFLETYRSGSVVTLPASTPTIEFLPAADESALRQMQADMRAERELGEAMGVPKELLDQATEGTNYSSVVAEFGPSDLAPAWNPWKKLTGLGAAPAIPPDLELVPNALGEPAADAPVEVPARG